MRKIIFSQKSSFLFHRQNLNMFANSFDNEKVWLTIFANFLLLGIFLVELSRAIDFVKCERYDESSLEISL